MWIAEQIHKKFYYLFHNQRTVKPALRAPLYNKPLFIKGSLIIRINE
jgi:hypothetical protein